MRLVLHIGTEKTGTTTFQNFCHANYKPLLDQGILYPQALGGENHRFIAIYGMSIKTADAFVHRLGIKTQHDMDEFYAQVERTLQEAIDSHHQARVCILSSEHLHSRLKSIDDVKRVYSLLEPLFDDIEVYVHLRPQVDVLVSFASTQAKGGGAVRRAFFERANSNNLYYNYEKLIVA